MQSRLSSGRRRRIWSATSEHRRDSSQSWALIVPRTGGSSSSVTWKAMALKAEHLAGEGGGERRSDALAARSYRRAIEALSVSPHTRLQTARQAERLRLERDERTVRVRNNGQTAVTDVEMLGHAACTAAGCAVLDERDRLVGQGAGQQVTVFELEQLACGCGLRTDEPVCVDQKHRGLRMQTAARRAP